MLFSTRLLGYRLLNIDLLCLLLSLSQLSFSFLLLLTLLHVLNVHRVAYIHLAVFTAANVPKNELLFQVREGLNHLLAGDDIVSLAEVQPKTEYSLLAKLWYFALPFVVEDTLAHELASSNNLELERQIRNLFRVRLQNIVDKSLPVALAAEEVFFDQDGSGEILIWSTACQFIVFHAVIAGSNGAHLLLDVH